MKCDRCRMAIPEGEQRNHNETMVCEDCYIDSLCFAEPVCNPWQEYLAVRSESTGDEENIYELKTRKNFTLLLETAYQLGASDAAFIKSNQIEISKDLAGLCQHPKCESYGASLSCPPYVSGPAGFSRRIKTCADAMVFRITVPSDIMYSHQRIEIFRLLHEIGSSIENQAKQMGYVNSRAYAAGSCKKLFCSEHLSCNVVFGQGECRNPDLARQSMSGFGINVKKLMTIAGLHSDTPEMKPACGLILIDSGAVCSS